MKQTGTDINRMVLHGRAVHPPAFSHCNHEVEFFSFPISVSRLSGVSDQVNVMVSRCWSAAAGWSGGRSSRYMGRSGPSTTAPVWGAGW